MRQHSEETKQKISASLKGRTISNEARENLSKALKGRAVSEGTKQKISKAAKKRVENGWVSPLKGKQRSQEVITKSVVARNINIEETGKKISKALTGKKLSEETKKKMSISGKGRPKSEATKKKMAERWTPEIKKQHAEKLKKYWTNEKRQEQSKISSQMWAEGKMSPIISMNNHWSTPTKYKGITMRSKLEVSYAKYLDGINEKWIYEPERFWLDELQCTYLPDFYLPRIDTYTEVKGWDQGLDKVETFRKMGNNIQIIRDGDF